MAFFEFFEHTADLGIRGYGDSFPEAIEGVARGMITHICDISKMEVDSSRRFELTANTQEDLVVRFLNRLLLLFETEHFVPVKYELIQLTPHTLQVLLHGDILDPAKDEVHAEIKAATYHNLKISQHKNWVIQVVVDV